MIKLKIVKILAVFVSIAGLAVVAGWIFDIDVLKSIFPGLISMKFTTAIAFVVSGALLFFLSRYRESADSTNQLIVVVCAGLLLLLMATFLLSSLFGIPVGLEGLFVQEPVNTAATIFPGRPSIATMADFVLVAIDGILLLQIAKNTFTARVFGWVIATTGVSAIVGYFFHIPAFYFYFANISNGMAIHTAIVFVLIGTAFIMMEKSSSDDIWPTAVR